MISPAPMQDSFSWMDSSLSSLSRGQPKKTTFFSLMDVTGPGSFCVLQSDRNPWKTFNAQGTQIMGLILLKLFQVLIKIKGLGVAQGVSIEDRLALDHLLDRQLHLLHV